MSDSYKEEYSESFSASAINAGAYEIFDNASLGNKMDKYGSANSLVITTVASEDFSVVLDGSKTMGICFARGGFIIRPEDGIFFNTVKLTNLSLTNSSADEIKVRIARAKRV